VLERIDRLYRRLFTDENVERVDHLTLVAAVLGFVIHLGLIGMAKFWPDAPHYIARFDGSFLSAIYTPFSFILFYEVFALILAVPRSFTSSVGIQLQLLALIIIRRIFGDIGHLDHLSTLTLDSEWVRLLGFDMLAALVMFFGVILFSRISRDVPDARKFENPETFIQLKRAITLFLAALLVVLAAATLYWYASESLRAIAAAQPITINENIVFYREMFTVMVFTDVAILLASLAYSHRFELVFRNAGFVVSTILVRLSLSIPRPIDLLFLLAALAFAISILYAYKLFLESEAREAVEESDDEPDIV
jgi:hypothetical protein